MCFSCPHANTLCLSPLPRKGLLPACVCLLSLLVMSNSLWPYGLYPGRLLCPWNSPGKTTGVASHSLLLGIFPIQGSNMGLLHFRQILYQLSHQRSPLSPFSFFLSRYLLISLFHQFCCFSVLCFLKLPSPPFLRVFIYTLKTISCFYGIKLDNPLWN